MGDKGIRIIQKFENEGPAASHVAVSRTVQYKDVDENWREQLWEKYKAILGEGSYEDDCWSASSEYGDHRTYIDWNGLDRWKDQLKTFLLLLLDKDLVPFSTVIRVSVLTKFILATDYFSPECYADFDDDPIAYCKGDMLKLDVETFCEFTGINPYRYLDRLKTLRFEDNPRDIPAFNSICKFDRLIGDCKNTIGPDDPFIIVVLWWELTKVIPIRPIEFFTLRKGSFFIENERYYVYVKRAKLKDTEHGIPVLEKIGISEEIYSLFDHYRDVHKDSLTDDDSFLFTVEIFNTFDRALCTSREGYIGAAHMYTLFRDFFHDIVETSYGYTVVPKGKMETVADNEIEYFQYGDSRHIAFLNLLLSGYSAYTIAQIGGHTTVRQQMHYYDHIESYLSSKAYTMAKEVQMPIRKYAKAFDIREKYALSIAYSGDRDLLSMRQIEFGWCSSENFPFDCEFDDCLTCPYSIVDDNHMGVIQKKIKSYRTDIHDHVEFLKRMLANEALGSDADRMTIINRINSDTAAMAALHTKQYKEV